MAGRWLRAGLWMGAWGVAPAAQGGTPVVHDAPNSTTTIGTEVIAPVAASTGLPPSQLTPVPLADLLAAPPVALGEAVIRRCTASPTDGTAPAAEVARAEVAWARGDAIEAADHLDLAVAYLGCLKTLVEAPTAAKAFRLRAAVAMGADGAGDVDGAKSELRTALGFEPQLSWDPSLPAAGAAMLSDARASARTVPVTLIPAGAPTGPWIDGRTVTGDAQLGAGLHLLQYGGTAGIRSAWVVVDGPARIVVPSGFRRPVVERFAVADGGRTEAEALLAATLPDFFAAYVVSGGGIWLVSDDGAGTLTTTVVKEPPPPPPPPEPGKKGKKR